MGSRCAREEMIVGHGEGKGLCAQDEGVRKTKDSKNYLRLDVCLLSALCLLLFMGLGHV